MGWRVSVASALLAVQALAIATAGLAGEPGQDGPTEREIRAQARMLGLAGGGLHVFRVWPRTDGSYGPTAAQDGRAGVPLDVAYAVRMVEGFALYRIGVRGPALAEPVLVLTPGGETPVAVPLVAWIPADVSPDGNGFRWSETTYCPGCFQLDRIVGVPERAGPEAFGSLDLAAEAATKTGEGGPWAGTVRVLADSPQGLRLGASGVRMAPIAGREAVAARRRLDSVLPALEEYKRFAAGRSAGETMPMALERTCRPHLVRDRGLAGTSREARALEGLRGCIDAFFSAYDRIGRTQEIERLKAEEAALAGSLSIPARFRMVLPDREIEERDARADASGWITEREDRVRRAENAQGGLAADADPMSWVADRVRGLDSRPSPPPTPSLAEVLDVQEAMPALPAGGTPVCATDFLCEIYERTGSGAVEGAVVLPPMPAQ